jgi:hypothetical protein
MSLSNLASLGSFISGFAVLISLIFLYFQIRQVSRQVKQSEKNQQAMIRQVRSNRTVDIALTGTDLQFSEAMEEVMSVSGKEPSAVALRQFASYWRATFYSWEDAFYQYQEGLLSDSAFNTFTVNIKAIMRSIPFRAQWRIWHYQYGSEFVAWMDQLIAETPGRESFDLAVTWKEALAAERAGMPSRV